MRYAVVIEQANANYSAYVPDLPDCVATGAMPTRLPLNFSAKTSASHGSASIIGRRSGSGGMPLAIRGNPHAI